jgi:hypothetical protein
MSRKQGPRAVGMRPSAIAAGRRHDALGKFTATMRGDDMHSEQGPACLGMGAPVHVVRVESLLGYIRSLNRSFKEVGDGY